MPWKRTNQEYVAYGEAQWARAMERSRGPGPKEDVEKEAPAQTPEEAEAASVALWAKYDADKALELVKKHRYVLDRAAPFYKTAKLQLQNYVWVPALSLNVDKWLNDMPETFDNDRSLSVGFDEVRASSHVISACFLTSCTQILAASVDDQQHQKDNPEPKPAGSVCYEASGVIKRVKRCGVHLCDGHERCGDNCRRNIFW